MNPHLDDTDSAILQKREAWFNSEQGPRVGDLVQMLDGTLRRFTHDWGDGIQTTYLWNDGRLESGSFYLGRDYVSYSGALDEALPLATLKDTGRTAAGRFWFFHHDRMQAHNAVHAEMACRIYEQTK